MRSLVTLLWIDSGDSATSQQLATHVSEQGFRVARRSAAESETLAEHAARVFVVDQAGELENIRRASILSPKPTLVVATKPELARDVAAFLPEEDEIALASDPAEVLARRLRRLIDRWEAAETSPEDRDSLTGVLNRRRLSIHLQLASSAVTADRWTALVQVDLDNFKSINDKFGHGVGDDVLRAVATCLSRSLAPADIVARVGGDEFVCLLSRYDPQTLTDDARKLMERLADPAVVAGLVSDAALRVSASGGLTFVRPGVGLERLMEEADVAMYEAKRTGKGRLVVYESLHEAARTNGRDLLLQHFENVTRVSTERVVELISLMGRRLVEAARQEANIDALTGLHNRRYFDAQLSREVERAQSTGRHLALALIDLDHFHDVNMTYGWPTGDGVLRGFADAALRTVRVADWVARYGGEEFVIVMPDTDSNGGLEVADRVRSAFADLEIRSIDGRIVHGTLSAGVAELDSQSDSAIDLVQRASAALLIAKEGGRDRVTQSC